MPAIGSQVEGQVVPVGVFPGQGCNRVRGDFQNDFIAVFDDLLLFFIPGKQQRPDAGDNQYTDETPLIS